MFKTLFWKEIREHLMTFRFGAALVTTFVLIVVSVWVLGDDYIRRRDTYNKLAEEAARESRNARVPSEVVPILHYPPSPLSIFAQGESKRLGNVVEINRWEVPRDAKDSLTDNMLLAAQPPFDLLAVFSVVISIFGVLLTYDSISGEKENGTLRMICTGRATRNTIFTAKFFAGLVVLALPFLLSFLSALLVLQFVLQISLQPAQWLAVAAMLFTGVLYGAVFVAVGLFSSAVMSRSSTALVFALLIWALGVLLIPAAANNAASLLHPLPSPSEITTMSRETYDEVIKRRDETPLPPEMENQDIIMHGAKGMMGPSPWLYDGSPAAFIFYAHHVKLGESLWRERAEKLWELQNKHDAALARQVEFASWFGFPAPANHLRDSFTALAGTDFNAYSDFMETARRYRRDFISCLEQKRYFGENAIKFFSHRPREHALSQEHYDERLNQLSKRLSNGESFQSIIQDWSDKSYPPDIVPPFEHKSGEPRFAEGLWPITAVAAILLLVFTAGFVAFTRYDVR